MQFFLHGKFESINWNLQGPSMAFLWPLGDELLLAIPAKKGLNLQVSLSSQLCSFQQTESGRNLTWH